MRVCVCERERVHSLEPCICEEEQNLRYWYSAMVANLWLNELGVKLAMAFCSLCAVEGWRMLFVMSSYREVKVFQR